MSFFEFSDASGLHRVFVKQVPIFYLFIYFLDAWGEDKPLGAFWEMCLCFDRVVFSTPDQASH